MNLDVLAPASGALPRALASTAHIKHSAVRGILHRRCTTVERARRLGHRQLWLYNQLPRGKNGVGSLSLHAAHGLVLWRGRNKDVRNDTLMRLLRPLAEPQNDKGRDRSRPLVLSNLFGKHPLDQVLTKPHRVCSVRRLAHHYRLPLCRFTPALLRLLEF